MSLITRMRKQKAVYWPLLGADAEGSPLYEGPQEIDCRWEDMAVEFLDREGTKQVSQSVVYVDRDTPIGGLLMLGTLDSVLDVVTPRNNTGVFEIRQFSKIPKLNLKETLLTAYL